MEGIEKILEVANEVIEFTVEDGTAEREAERQTQILNALGTIQNTLKDMQVEQEQLADVIRISPSFTEIASWQAGYPIAVQNNDVNQISAYVQQLNSKGQDGAAFMIQNIFNVLTGQGLGSSSGPGATPMLQMWHQQSYKKMYTAIDGQYTFTLRNYLDDYDKIISWGIGMAGFALVCQIIALQDLADKTTDASAIQNEATTIKDNFATNSDAVLAVAYDQFPSFVKKFKPNYRERGTNLAQWFRMWRPGSHVKNYVGWSGVGTPTIPIWNYTNDPRGLESCQICPLACDDEEGIYPELEFRFDEDLHPLDGPAKLISRIDGAIVQVYYYLDINENHGPNSIGLTTTADPAYWKDGISFIQASFNILPLSADDMDGNQAPGFVLMVANAPCYTTNGDGPWLWIPGLVSPVLEYWILRDDGLVQSSWFRTQDDDTNVPGEPSRAPGPNPQ